MLPKIDNINIFGIARFSLLLHRISISSESWGILNFLDKTGKRRLILSMISHNYRIGDVENCISLTYLIVCTVVVFAIKQFSSNVPPKKNYFSATTSKNASTPQLNLFFCIVTSLEVKKLFSIEILLIPPFW